VFKNPSLLISTRMILDILRLGFTVCVFPSLLSSSIVFSHFAGRNACSCHIGALGLLFSLVKFFFSSLGATLLTSLRRYLTCSYKCRVPYLSTWFEAIAFGYWLLALIAFLSTVEWHCYYLLLRLISNSSFILEQHWIVLLVALTQLSYLGKQNSSELLSFLESPTMWDWWAKKILKDKKIPPIVLLALESGKGGFHASSKLVDNHIGQDWSILKELIHEEFLFNPSLAH